MKTMSDTKKVNNRRAQEEMFGFVIIVVMLMIIGIVFLFLYKPKAPEAETYIKKNIDNLLYSALSYNADGKGIREMIEECYYGTGCNALSTKLKDIIDTSLEKSSLVVGKQIRGYNLNITDSVEISEGEISGNMASSVIPVTSTADIEAMFSVYY